MEDKSLEASCYSVRCFSGKELVDYISHYLNTIRERRVVPDVKPGYMKELLPDAAPEEPEDWDSVFSDIERVIMPGVVHWQSPYMHAYFPGLCSWPSLLGDMIADAINCIGFTWASCPASTELEINVMDWLCKALGLPSFFLHHHPDSIGGGVLQGTVSESTLVALLAARKDKISELQADLDQEVEDSILNARLVAYASEQAHSSVEKAGLISLVKIRFLPPDEHLSLRGETLKQAIQEDRKRGLVPFMLCATLGTTGVCAFDNLSELGPVCAEEGLWLHVDAAYAGSAYVCPELRWSLEGIEFAHSFVFNPSKWLLVHFDCTAFWVKDKFKLQKTFTVDPVYLRHENSRLATDYMHWQIPLSRRFRSLKVWFVMRLFGLKNLQAHIRHGNEMARLFESYVRSDPNFEVPAKRHLGLVVFCLKGGNALTQELLRRLTQSGTMHLIPADIYTKRIIRFSVTSQFTTPEDILRDWSIISEMASTLLAETQALNNADQPNSGEEEVTRAENIQGTNSDIQEREEAAPGLDKVEMELWIDKARDQSERPLRSLSCSSEPLPCTDIGPMSGHDCETRPTPKDAAGGLQHPTAEPDPAIEITDVPSDDLGNQVLKKLTKFYSMPSFCNQWVQCGRHQVCCPLEVSQTSQTQKHLTSNCRTTNCMSSSPVANAATSPTTLESAAVPELI